MLQALFLRRRAYHIGFMKPLCFIPRVSLKNQAGLQDHPSPHPFVEAVLRDCASELSTMKGHANFYQKMSFLEAKVTKLSHACRQTAFTGSAEEPNEKIFKSWVENSLDFSAPQLPGKEFHQEFTLGYVKAPLFFSKPERSPIYKTWFLLYRAKVQPAPAGLLFIHLGGPSPGINSGLGIMASFPKEHLDFVYENFDLLVVDQRGMGLSSLGLLKTPESFPLPESAEEFFTLPSTILGSKGSLTEVVKDSKGGTHEFPCHQMSVDHQNEWIDLRDMANLEEVNTFMDAKAKFTALCSAQFDRADGEGRSFWWWRMI